MKRPVLVVVSMLCYANLVATPADSGCTYTFFSDGGTASSRCTDETGVEATVRVYNRDGEIIGEWGLLRRPRASNIDMAFHPDGMVRRVRYTWQPDGGIQWYRSTTIYDSDGTIIDFQEQSHDTFDRIRAIDPFG